jgi:hypothetical protein
VHLNASDGRAYAPSESWFRADWLMFDHMDQSEYHYFHTDGDFELDLPPGRATLAFSRGFEYVPMEREVEIRAAQPASLTVSLERLDNLPARGWWDGDNHFHMNYAGVYFNTPQRLMEQAEAEDIHVLNNLICNKEQRIPDVAHFRGSPDPVSTATRILYHGQEYHPPFWGHSAFLNLTRHLVIPDYVGYQNTIVNSLYPSNTVPFRVTREQKGLAGYAHGAGTHFPVDLALENVDFVEVNSIQGMQPLYKAWNCGYKVVASAGEDAFPNFYRSYILGSNRVYVHSPGKLDYDKWIAGFRAGRSFVTSGPLVSLTVNGKGPGDEIQLPAGAHKVEVDVEVASIMPVESVSVLRNGEVVETVRGDGKQRRLKFSRTVTVDRSGWLGVETRARYARTPIRRPFPFAATMPVWVTLDGRPARSRRDAEYFIAWMEKSLSRAMAQEAWNNQQERDDTRELYEEAKRRMERRRDEAEPAN